MHYQGVCGLKSLSQENRFLDVTKPYWKDLYRFLTSITKNSELAGEISQETLLKAFKGFEGFLAKKSSQFPDMSIDELLQYPEVKRNVKFWLLRVGKNVYLSWLAAHSKDHINWEIVDGVDGLAQATSIWNAEPITEASLVRETKKFFELACNDELKNAIDSLNPKQKTILFLICEDYSYSEIAEILQIPVGTVMSNLSRTIKKLKEM